MTTPRKHVWIVHETTIKPDSVYTYIRAAYQDERSALDELDRLSDRYVTFHKMTVTDTNRHSVKLVNGDVTKQIGCAHRLLKPFV